MSQERKPPVLPEIYFDHAKGLYWLRLEASRFIQLDKSSVKLHLRRAGLSDDNIIKGLGIGEVENHVYMTQTKRAVDYSGPLSGHKCGQFVTSSGAVILVVSEPKLFAAKAGDTKWIDRFLTELLGNQVQHFLWWLKFARASLLAFDFRPGQLVVLAGPSGCGKSLLQALVTEFLGGRSAKPYRYMIGETAFNGEVAGAEHLVIEDEAASHDIRRRRQFGAKLKEFVVNKELSIHAKGRQAISLPTFRRMTLSVNDEPENLTILPPLDPSIMDKIALFQCGRAELPSDRVKVWQALTSELPALAAHVDRLKVPKQWRCDRYGARAFHNAELLEAIGGLAPETHLEHLIDEVLLKDGPWRGSAMELQKELTSAPGYGSMAGGILYNPSVAGTYLARLAQKEPGRYVKKINHGKTVWTISPAK